MGIFDICGLVTARPSTVQLPPGRVVELPGRGSTFIWEAEGPPGAPTVMLLHGLVASGGLNWFPAFRRLSENFHVVAMDLRGHGRGQRVGIEFRLSDCADDAASLADVLGIERFIAVGYSLGGPVAQLLWHRHREKVAGLVLCATSRNFGGTAPERAFFSLVLAGIFGLQVANHLPFIHGSRPVLVAASHGGAAERLEAVAEAMASDDEEPPGPDEDPLLSRWALAELRRTNVLSVVKALGSMGRFSSHEWVGAVDVPVAVVVTTRDHLVSASRQIKLAQAIPGATLHPVPAGHAACVVGARRFVPVFREAVRSVAGRAGLESAAQN